MSGLRSRLGEIIDRASVANIVAGVAVLTGVVYAFRTQDVNLITFLAGAGIGYLFKEVS